MRGPGSGVYCFITSGGALGKSERSRAERRYP